MKVIKNILFYVICIVLIILIAKFQYKQDKKAIDYCMNQGYSYNNCVATINGYN